MLAGSSGKGERGAREAELDRVVCCREAGGRSAFRGLRRPLAEKALPTRKCAFDFNTTLRSYGPCLNQRSHRACVPGFGDLCADPWPGLPPCAQLKGQPHPSTMATLCQPPVGGGLGEGVRPTLWETHTAGSAAVSCTRRLTTKPSFTRKTHRQPCGVQRVSHRGTSVASVHTWDRESFTSDALAIRSEEVCYVGSHPISHIKRRKEYL